MEGQRLHRLPELDGLRGLLAVWVWLYHAPYISGDWNSLPEVVRSFLGGDKAVDVFIILSGFVIALLLLRERGILSSLLMAAVSSAVPRLLCV